MCYQTQIFMRYFFKHRALLPIYPKNSLGNRESGHVRIISSKIQSFTQFVVGALQTTTTTYGTLKLPTDRHFLFLSCIFYVTHKSIFFTSFCFADVSKNWAFHDSANFCPSNVDTARSWNKSVLLPTKITGTL